MHAWAVDLQLVSVAVMMVLFTATATRNIHVTLLVIFSFLALLLPFRFGFSTWSLISSGLSLFAFAIVLFLSDQKMIFTLDPSIEIKKWRIVTRPFALLFIPIKIFMGQKFLLYLLGGLSLFFIGADLYRLFSKRRMSRFFKKNEFQRFSSMTSFLVAIFIVFLLFPAPVAYLCLCFILFGDMGAKLTGLRFGRTTIIHDKTLEGSLGFLTGSLYTGFILCTVLNIEFSYLIIGAFVATVVELFSYHMDDNFTVGILTGGCLMALKYFQVI